MARIGVFVLFVTSYLINLFTGDIADNVHPLIAGFLAIMLLWALIQVFREKRFSKLDPVAPGKSNRLGH